MYKYLFALLATGLLANLSLAQEQDLSADDLFIKARDFAFEQKDYDQAKKLTKEALRRSPNYVDLSVFLGRLYTWTDEIDSARHIFLGLEQRNIENEDFFLAYASLEYWNDNSAKAIQLLNKGIQLNPTSEDLMYLKARVNYSADNYEQAEDDIVELLKINPKHTEARALATRINESAVKNAIGVTYNFTHFDTQFENNWHIVGVSYKRRTSIGSVIFRTNYANKFADNGLQFEAEAYPRLSKMFYMYVGAGYSNNVGIFPKYRSGASLYANLPKSFEAEVGFRQLYFSDNLFMYTASVGKYYSNYWFNLKTFLTPSAQNISHSYTGTIRYYTKGAQDYIGFQLGTGISPEDNRANLLGLEAYKLKTYKIGADYNFSFKKTNFFSLSATYFNQEYKPKTKGNQFDISVGYVKTF